jgi:hypothetical protein
MRNLILMLFAVVLMTGLCGVTAAQIGGDVGYYHITSTPSGASVTFDGSPEGTTPTTVQVYTTGTPGHTLFLTLTGYQDYSQYIAGNPSAGQTIYISATLTPLPGSQKGYYYISSSPSGATVYFDGNYKGTTPVTVEVSTTGTPSHSLSLSLSGYQTYTQSIAGNPSAGQTITIYATLTPSQNYGSVYVTSSPSGATATLDNYQTGTTPYTFTYVAVGSHTIQISRSGYQTYTGTVSVSSGSTATVSVSLPPISSSVGSLYITSTPSGAQLYVDSSYRGTTPTTVGSLAPGAHTVLLRLSGYQDFSGTATIYAGQTTTMSANLVQVTPTSTVGTLAISSSPSAAEVYVDNVFRGYTPLTLTDISPGSHAITLQLAGYQNWLGTVQVSGGQTTTVQGTLSPNPTTVPTTKAPGFGVLAGIAALGLLGALLVLKRD